MTFVAFERYSVPRSIRRAAQALAKAIVYCSDKKLRILLHVRRGEWART